MLDLGALAPAGRRLYAQSLAGALAAGLSPLAAEAIAKDALVKAGLVAVMKSAEPVRVAKRLEVKAKPEPTEADLGAGFVQLYQAAKAASPREPVGAIYSRLAREHPLAADAYRSALTSR